MTKVLTLITLVLLLASPIAMANEVQDIDCSGEEIVDFSEDGCFC